MFMSIITLILCVPSPPKKNTQQKKATDLPSWQCQHVSCLFCCRRTAGVWCLAKISFGSSFGTELHGIGSKATCHLVERHGAPSCFEGKGKGGLIMMEYLHLLYTSDLYKSILKMGRKKGGLIAMQRNSVSHNG